MYDNESEMVVMSHNEKTTVVSSSHYNNYMNS